MAPDLSLADRDAIEDLLHRYLWCMDTGDIEGVAATFAPGGKVKDISGRLWDDAEAPRSFARHFISRPDRPTAQHWVQHMAFEGGSDGARVVTSYWFTVALGAEGQRGIAALGRYIDTCVQIAGRWLIASKRIDPWTDETVEMIGQAAPRA